MSKPVMFAATILSVALLRTGLGISGGAPLGDYIDQEKNVAKLPRPWPPERLHVSNPVTMKDLAFEVVASPVWPTPGPNGVSLLRLQLQVTNLGKETVRFLPILGEPILRTADGEPLTSKNHGRNGGRRLPEPLVLDPGKTVTVEEPLRLASGGAKGMSLNWNDETGSYLSIDMLQPGTYLLALHYNTTKRKGVWAGEVRTESVPVEIRELSASPPTVANDLELVALADGAWPVPAVGKHNVVYLGFRIQSVRKPVWARVIPSITEVKMTSSDGQEMPVKKATAVRPARQPQGLHMEPAVSRTLAQPARIAPFGQCLVLTWVDAGGNSWHIEGLQPGKYTVRYVIRAQEGKTAQDWTTWTGEMQTATLNVEIKR